MASNGSSVPKRPRTRRIMQAGDASIVDDGCPDFEVGSVTGPDSSVLLKQVRSPYSRSSVASCSAAESTTVELPKDTSTIDLVTSVVQQHERSRTSNSDAASKVTQQDPIDDQESSVLSRDKQHVEKKQPVVSDEVEENAEHTIDASQKTGFEYDRTSTDTSHDLFGSDRCNSGIAEARAKASSFVLDTHCLAPKRSARIRENAEKKLANLCQAAFQKQAPKDAGPSSLTLEVPENCIDELIAGGRLVVEDVNAEQSEIFRHKEPTRVKRSGSVESAAHAESSMTNDKQLPPTPSDEHLPDELPLGKVDDHQSIDSNSLTASREEHRSSGEDSASPVVLFRFPPGDTRGKVQVTMEDFERLSPGQYLNDSLVDFYVKWIRFVLIPSTQDESKVFFFSSFFFGRLRRSEPIDYAGVQRWTNDADDLFKKRYVFVPVCDSNHWSLVLVANLDVLADYIGRGDDEWKGNDLDRPAVLYLDSLSTSRGNEFARVMRSYLVEEWLFRKEKNGDFDKSITPSRREVIHGIFRKVIKLMKPRVPLQKNEFDCGLYVLYNMLAFLRDYNGFRQKCMSAASVFTGQQSLQKVYMQSDILTLRIEIRHLIIRLTSLDARAAFACTSNARDSTSGHSNLNMNKNTAARCCLEASDKLREEAGGIDKSKSELPSTHKSECVKNSDSDSSPLQTWNASRNEMRAISNSQKSENEECKFRCSLVDNEDTTGARVGSRKELEDVRTGEDNEKLDREKTSTTCHCGQVGKTCHFDCKGSRGAQAGEIEEKKVSVEDMKCTGEKAGAEHNIQRYRRAGNDQVSHTRDGPINTDKVAPIRMFTEMHSLQAGTFPPSVQNTPAQSPQLCTDSQSCASEKPMDCKCILATESQPATKPCPEEILRAKRARGDTESSTDNHPSDGENRIVSGFCFRKSKSRRDMQARGDTQEHAANSPQRMLIDSQNLRRSCSPSVESAQMDTRSSPLMMAVPMETDFHTRDLRFRVASEVVNVDDEGDSEKMEESSSDAGRRSMRDSDDTNSTRSLGDVPMPECTNVEFHPKKQ